MYQLILLDADDTLFDFGRAETEAFDRTLADLGRGDEGGRAAGRYRIINRDLWTELEQRRISKDVLRTERFRRLFAEFGWDDSPTVASQAFVGHLSEGSHLLAGAEEVCRALAATHRLAIVTNGITEVQKSRLAGSTIGAYISHLVISDEVGVGKPDPAIFAQALKVTGHTDKASVLMVGDSLSADIAGGQNFGIDTCWFNPEGRPTPDGLPPTYTIRRLEELLTLV